MEVQTTSWTVDVCDLKKCQRFHKVVSVVTPLKCRDKIITNLLQSLIVKEFGKSGLAIGEVTADMFTTHGSQQGLVL